MNDGVEQIGVGNHLGWKKGRQNFGLESPQVVEEKVCIDFHGIALSLYSSQRSKLGSGESMHK